MKKYFSLIVISFVVSASVASAAALTQQQIDAIIGLLQSFGTDASVVTNVRSTLNGTPPPAGSREQASREQASSTSDEGRPFTATSNVNVRSEPDAGVVVATMPAGSEGLIFGDPYDYKLRRWEYVVFDAGPQGWVATEFGKFVRLNPEPFPGQCYNGTWPKPGSKCTANADGASYTCGGATYRKPTLSPCAISAPDTVYQNEPFTISVTGGTDQSISVGEWRGSLSPAMCPSTLTNCTGTTCTLEATATQPGTVIVGFFTHKPAPGGINVYGPTCRKVIRAQVRTGGSLPPPPSSQQAMMFEVRGAPTGLTCGEVVTMRPLSDALSADSVPQECVAQGTTYLTGLVRFKDGTSGWLTQPKREDGGLGTFPLPPPPPAARLTTPPPPPAGSSCPNDWNATSGGYYQAAGCACKYYDYRGRQTIGLPQPARCAPITQTPYVPEPSLNFSPQRAGSPQAGSVLWSNEAGSNVYTGTDFPVGAEPSLVKTYPGGWLACSPGQFISRYGLLVQASGGNDAIFKKNGTAEDDGVYYWGTLPDGSYQWIPMTLDEYRANPDRVYARAGWNGAPYAPNCIINTMVGTPPAPAEASRVAELKFDVGASVRIKPHSTLGDITVYYRNDPLSDGKCGTVIGEKATGASGTITQSGVYCGPGRYWKIRFDGGGEGWVIQNRIQPVTQALQGQTLSDPAIANTLDGLRRSIESLQSFINQH
jgi:hypothetical protein